MICCDMIITWGYGRFEIKSHQIARIYCHIDGIPVIFQLKLFGLELKSNQRDRTLRQAECSMNENHITKLN